MTARPALGAVGPCERRRSGKPSASNSHNGSGAYRRGASGAGAHGKRLAWTPRSGPGAPAFLLQCTPAATRVRAAPSHLLKRRGKAALRSQMSRLPVQHCPKLHYCGTVAPEQPVVAPKGMGRQVQPRGRPSNCALVIYLGRLIEHLWAPGSREWLGSLLSGLNTEKFEGYSQAGLWMILWGRN